jgi:hypothetical protein
METNFEVGDLIAPMRANQQLGIYVIVGIGPTTDQLTCRSLSSEPLGNLYTYFPSEVMWAWKPSYNRFAPQLASV